MSPHLEQVSTSDRTSENQATSSFLSQSINFADHNFAGSHDSTAKLNGNILSFGNPNYGSFAQPTDCSSGAQPGAEATNSPAPAAPTDSDPSASQARTVDFVQPTSFGAAEYGKALVQPADSGTDTNSNPVEPPSCSAEAGADSAPAALAADKPCSAKDQFTRTPNRDTASPDHANPDHANPDHDTTANDSDHTNPDHAIDARDPTACDAKPGADSTPGSDAKPGKDTANPSALAGLSDSDIVNANLDRMAEMMTNPSAIARYRQ